MADTSATPDTAAALEDLLNKLAARLSPAPAVAPDAIDAVLSSTPRTTAVTSLRNDPVIQAFRQELSDGLIRVDTAHQLIALLSNALDKLPAAALPGIGM